MTSSHMSKKWEELVGGRDGKSSEALLMFHGGQFRQCTPEMLNYVKSTSC